MDRSAFEKELAKYKIVREENHYQPRTKRVEVKTIANKLVSNEPKVKLQVVDDNEPFWSLLEKAAREILAAEEVEKFMGAVKKNYGDVADYINLEDLNVAASFATNK